jgi:hypothetical protein
VSGKGEQTAEGKWRGRWGNNRRESLMLNIKGERRGIL